MKIVVSGSQGFLGRHVIRALIGSGHVVVGISRTSVDEVSPQGTSTRANVDGRLDSLIGDHGSIDAIVHCATLYRRKHAASEITALVESNVTLGTQLVELATQHSARFVNISTFFQHEDGRPHNPISLYATLKDAMAEIVEFYVRRCSLNAIDLYLYNNFGPNDTRDKIVPLLVRACHLGESISLNSPRALINLLYVEDVVAAILSAIGSNEVGRYSVASSTPVSVGELVSMVEKVTNRQLDLTWSHPDGSIDPPIPSLYPSLPGWSPKWTIEQGLRELWTSIK